MVLTESMGTTGRTPSMSVGNTGLRAVVDNGQFGQLVNST